MKYRGDWKRLIITVFRLYRLHNAVREKLLGWRLSNEQREAAELLWSVLKVDSSNLPRSSCYQPQQLAYSATHNNPTTSHTDNNDNYVAAIYFEDRAPHALRPCMRVAAYVIRDLPLHCCHTKMIYVRINAQLLQMSQIRTEGAA